uniref:Uncharacterized protein n=1 Tax=Arion vulgaris TaxID=1028688 RepID=A0A0B7B5R7_9EUPU
MKRQRDLSQENEHRKMKIQTFMATIYYQHQKKASHNIRHSTDLSRLRHHHFNKLKIRTSDECDTDRTASEHISQSCPVYEEQRTII